MDILDQILDFYKREADYYLTTIFPPFPEIEKACGVPKEDWLDVARCKSYLEKNWIDEDEYHKIWEPIQTSIFLNRTPIQVFEKPATVFNSNYTVKGYLGGQAFYSKAEFLRFQRYLAQIGEQRFVIIEDIAWGPFPIRLRLDAGLSWEELLSYGFFYLIVMNHFFTNFYLYSESRLWGQFVACECKYPYNYLGIKNERADLFTMFEQYLPEDEILYEGGLYRD